MKNKKLFFIPLVLTFFLTGCLSPISGDNSNGNNEDNNGGQHYDGDGGNGGNTNSNGESTNPSGGGNTQPGGNTETTTFPTQALQLFLSSQGLTTTVPSPVASTTWTKETKTDDNGDPYFHASTSDKGTIGTNAIEDTYKALLVSKNWSVDDTAYEQYGYFAEKGDVELQFFTDDGTFDFFAFALNSGGNGGGSSTATSSLTAIVEDILNETFDWEVSDDGNYLDAIFDVDSGTPQQNCTSYYNALIAGGFTSVTAPEYDTYYNDGTYYAELYYQDSDNEAYIYAWDETTSGTTYHVVQIGVIADGQGGNGGGSSSTSSLTAIVEAALNETFDWEASSSGDYLDAVFTVNSGTPQQNCTSYYNALIAGGFTGNTAPVYDTDYNDGTYYADLYYQDAANEAYIYAWDDDTSGTTYHVVQIGVIADGQGGNSQVDNDELFDGPSAPMAQAEWTLMFYVCGSNLESDSQSRLATMDIEEILSVTGKPNNVNIIFETGGAESWSSQYGIKSTRLSRFHVANGQLVNDSQLANDSMGKPETLQSFLEWGMTYFPAEKYGIFMWNHGGAMDGCCFDELYHDDCLTNYELNKAVTDAKTTCNVDKLEFIAYDACLMAVQDVAEFNSHNFNYMLCSQESESGYGYDYDEWLSSLYANPTTIKTEDLLEEIGHTFIEEEKAIYQQYSEPFDQTQSVYDLSKMAAYKDAFEAIASSLKSSITNSSTWNSFVSNNVNKNNVQKYGVDDDGNYLFDIFDAEDVLNNIKSNYSSLSTQVDACLAALDALVVYEEHGSATSGCGLNIYCPVHSDYNRYSAKDTNFTNWYSLVNYSGLCVA